MNYQGAAAKPTSWDAPHLTKVNQWISEITDLIRTELSGLDHPSPSFLDSVFTECQVKISTPALFKTKLRNSTSKTLSPPHPHPKVGLFWGSVTPSCKNENVSNACISLSRVCLKKFSYQVKETNSVTHYFCIATLKVRYCYRRGPNLVQQSSKCCCIQIQFTSQSLGRTNQAFLFYPNSWRARTIYFFSLRKTEE